MLKNVDINDKPIRKGMIVRVLSVPSLKYLQGNKKEKKETRAVFQHIVGTYRKVVGFGRYGHVELSFHIRSGKLKGLHSVLIEPNLLRVKAMRTKR